MKRRWAAAETAQLVSRYPDEPTDRIARTLRRSLRSVYMHAAILGLKKSAAYLAGPHACRLRGDSGAAHRFKPGQIPHNKGLRRPGWGPGRMKETQFRKGERRGVAVQLYKPIGAERINKDGYLERKVNDDKPERRRWRAVHVLVWEAARGPVPKGHTVTFRNGNKRDIRLDNLECISRQELMARNTVHRLPKPLAETIQLLGALKRQIRKRTNAEESHNRPA